MALQRKCVLLVSRDPVFAWALKQRVHGLGWDVEHVYTRAEAHLRMSRYCYHAFLLDAPTNHELDFFQRSFQQKSPVFVLLDSGDVNLDTFREDPRTIYLLKEDALPSIVTRLEMLAQNGSISPV